MHNHSVGKSPKNVSLFLVFVYRKSFSIFVQKSCKKNGLGLFENISIDGLGIKTLF